MGVDFTGRCEEVCVEGGAIEGDMVEGGVGVARGAVVPTD